MKLLGNYKNGNYTVSIFSDGTKIRRTEEDEFKPAFSENCDIKITNYCDIGCPMCHEASCTTGKHADLNMKFLDTLHPFTELALGGGSVLAHPDFVPFLEKLKEKKVIANITVNQIHFEKSFEFLKELYDKDLFKGIGISLTNPNEEFIEKVKKFPTAVIHTINGLLTEEDIENLVNKDLKILILGYKTFRRGETHYINNKEEIESNKKFLYDNLPVIISKFKSVSFDNLAIKQLDVKRLMSDKEWENFYMGDDGNFTFYIDMVEKKFAKSSVSTKRYDILDNIDEMFNIVRNEK